KPKELRQFWTPEEHIRAHGFDTDGLRLRLSEFYRH
ncbi:transketolase, partial [Escherichia coli]|nr:transketolase [Escherichia coli]